MGELRIREVDTTPICSHCSATLQEILCRKISSTLGVRYIYFCPHCNKILGISHRKGLWMG